MNSAINYFNMEATNRAIAYSRIKEMGRIEARLKEKDTEVLERYASVIKPKNSFQDVCSMFDYSWSIRIIMTDAELEKRKQDKNQTIDNKIYSK